MGPGEGMARLSPFTAGEVPEQSVQVEVIRWKYGERV